MFKKKVLFLVLFILIVPSVFASYLGIFEPGDGIRYSVVCLEDGGKRDTGCTGGGGQSAHILGPFDSSPINSSLDEVSDTSVPGLWRGNYTVGIDNQTGLWSIYINLTNSNSTPSSTVLHFQVVGDTHGIDTIGSNVATAVSNQAVIKANIEEHNKTMKKLVVDINQSIKDNITASTTDIMTDIEILKLNMTNLRINVTSILTRIGDPNEYSMPNIMHYLYGNKTYSTDTLLDRIWNYADRMTRGIRT